ncbi:MULTISPECIES: Ig-like domain-containing protein [unclassified Rathayibacter]|uniref:Ig-like domain-containing protein n=1 Tax=unclassified Rathayibacter TaxID=2609250 RepID=UPI0011B05C8B|nr:MULTISPECIES: Ig-like domain-containing protein [unclassified Rathayibacter]
MTGTAYSASVAEAAARASAYNSALLSACDAAANDCIWDGGAITRMSVPLSTIATDVDYFHPNVSGQAKIAATTWNAWGLPLGGTTPTPTPTSTPTSTPAVDTIAPSVRITSPATGTTVGSSVTFVASATDNVGTTRVSFWSGSTRLGDATRATDGSWRLTVSTSAYPAGRYSITARALDAAGNEGRSAAVSITR